VADGKTNSGVVLPHGGPAYFSFVAHDKWRVMVLDSYDLCTMDPVHGSSEDAFR
jgi:hypothetical protein